MVIFKRVDYIGEEFLFWIFILIKYINVQTKIFTNIPNFHKYPLTF